MFVQVKNNKKKFRDKYLGVPTYSHKLCKRIDNATPNVKLIIVY